MLDFSSRFYGSRAQNIHAKVFPNLLIHRGQYEVVLIVHDAAGFGASGSCCTSFVCCRYRCQLLPATGPASRTAGPVACCASAGCRSSVTATAAAGVTEATNREAKMAEAGYVRLPPAEKGQLLVRLQSLFQRVARASEPPRSFAGSMPVTLSRRHFSMVRDCDYLLLEKSDGVRYLLFATELGVLLVDRRLDLFAVTPYPVLMMPDGSLHQDTLLDGELVYNECIERFEYLAYDVIAIQGDTGIAYQSYRVRLDAIERYVTGPRALHPATAGCLRVRRKDVYEKAELPLLFSRIYQGRSGKADDPQGGAPTYTYRHLRSDGVFQSGNDGIIFTPVGLPYTLRTCAALLKYKYPTHNTVDFILWLQAGNDPANDVRAFLGYRGDNGVVRYREVYFPSRLKREWFADYARWHEAVIECTYDRLAGEWRFLRPRLDKESPNYASVVIDCLEAIAENVTRAELLERVCGLEEARQRCRALLQTKTATGNALQPGDLFDESDWEYLRTTPISLLPPPRVSDAVR
jgi:mRNA guanylyltransferase